MILADTSAWVEFDRATGSAVDTRLAQLIADEESLAVTEPVIMEVLAGARTESGAQDLRRLLLRFDLHALEPAVDFDAAARIYRRCRKSGVTPRGLVDCLIAAVAGRRGATLLAFDVDLHRVAGVIGIDVDSASHPAN
ncbi:MAG: PIN domain nuclease [Microlunatus sp.]|nr:PIN domain nuclease [Microlunatus sp.]MDN5770276.1 PIN domain nuclease [Microlunatus sp.]